MTAPEIGRPITVATGVRRGVAETGLRPARAPRQQPKAAASGWARSYARRLMVTDLMMLVLVGLAVHLVRWGDLDGVVRLSSAAGVWPVVGLTSLIVVVWLTALTVIGSRRPPVVGFGATEYKRVAQATLAVFGGLAILSYLLGLRLPRSYLVVMLPLGMLALLAARYLWRRWLHKRRDFGHYQSRMVAVGSTATVADLVRDLQRSPRAGFRVVGVCLTDADRGADNLALAGLPILGGVSDVPQAVRTCGADTVAVTATDEIGPAAVRNLSWQLEDLDDVDCSLVLAPALTDIAGPRVHTQPVNGLPLIHVDRPTYRGANRLLKKMFDVAGAAVLLVMLSVPLLVIGVVVKATSRGPVFFRQPRVGLNGSTFGMIKFRSMVTNAEELLPELQRRRDELAAAATAASTDAAGAGTADGAGNAVMFKLVDDPRITKAGKWLRRFSLDELPQLFNVLGGSMSLVGPRPPLPEEVAKYENHVHRRLLVKPGMTGLWQVSGRSRLSWEETVRLDSYYVENWSMTGDLQILWKTARAVVGRDGAY